MQAGFQSKPIQMGDSLSFQAVLLSTFLNQSTVGMFVTRNGVFASINDYCSRLFGYTVAELQGREVTLIFSTEAQQTMLEFFSGLREGEYHHIHYTLPAVSKDCRQLQVEITGLAYLENGQRISMVICSNLDEQRVNEERSRTAYAIFNSVQEGIMLTDNNANILIVNPAFSRITGYSQEELQGQNPRILKSGRQDKEFYEALWQQLTTLGSWQGEIWNKKKDGKEYKESLSIYAIKSHHDENMGYVSICSDLSERLDLLAELSFTSAHDPLTGLPNRGAFKQEVQSLVEQPEGGDPHFAVVQVGVDRFRNLNNSLGHYLGDQLLSAMAERIEGCLVKGETAARFGGDIFSLTLTRLDSLSTLNTRLLNILETIRKPYWLNGSSFSATASLGVAVYPEDGGDAEKLIQNADNALSHAKALGGDMYLLHDFQLNERTRRWFHLSNALRAAVQEHQFRMVYQPQVELMTGKIQGLEALARWEHPRLGNVPPDEFIPIMEEIGLSHTLTEFVLDDACRQINANHWENIPNFRLAVNLSLRQLRQPDLLEHLQSALRRHLVSGTLLEIEVTESNAMSAPDYFRNLFERIKELGISIAIDDFGTGHSSLAYLSLFPIDKIKIDKSFISNLPAAREKQAIVRAILSLAESLGVQVVAEGVEYAQQADFLRGTYCQLIQGFLVSEPVPPEKINLLLSEQLFSSDTPEGVN